MIFAGLFLAELLILFFLSRALTRRLSFFVHHLVRSQKATIYIMALLFFPGTVIHELSHMLMAGLLFVPVGQVDLWPKLEGQHIKMGSVTVGNTDIIRRFLIGAAPFLLGTSLLLGLLFYAAQNNLLVNTLYIFLMAYVSFEIGNTMFSSKKDMEGALELLATIILLGIIIYFLGVRIPNFNPGTIFENKIISQVFHQGSLYLLIPLGLDVLILFLLKILSFRKN